MLKSYLMKSALITIFIVTFNVVYASKILMVMPIATKSHKIYLNGIAEALAKRGHQVTSINPFKPTEVNVNIREVTIPDSSMETIVGNAFEMSLYNFSKNFYAKGIGMCVKSMLHKPVQEVLKEEYDFAILSISVADCYYGYIHEKKIPYAYIYPNVLINYHSETLGNLYLSSITPNLFLKSVHPMTFFERLKTAIADFYLSCSTLYFTERSVRIELEKENLLPSNMPSLYDFYRNASLGIVNSVRTLEIPAKSYSQNVVFAGGLHIKPPGKMPEDIERWIQDSGDEGFIFFSLGSSAKTSDMKEENRQILLKVFGSLKQRVLWKWDQTTMQDLPPNVKISKWLPQQAILAHPKIRLFITHGGLLSTQEATYYGVPVVGMPVFLDQHRNVAQVETEGWGTLVNWKDLSEDYLRENIVNVLQNPSIQQTVTRRSKLMQDLPLSPSEEVVYWIEYTIRHDGARHLQPPIAYMSWFHIYNVDVWGFVVIVILVELYLLKRFLFFRV